MSSTTVSTLSVEVNAKNSVETLRELKAELLAVAVAARLLGKQGTMPASASQSTSEAAAAARTLNADLKETAKGYQQLQNGLKGTVSWSQKVDGVNRSLRLGFDATGNAFHSMVAQIDKLQKTPGTAIHAAAELQTAINATKQIEQAEKERQRTLKGQQAAYADRENRAQVAAAAEVAAQQKLAAALEKERQRTLKGQQAAYADRENRAQAAAAAEVATQQKLAAALEKERQKTLKGQQAAYADRVNRAQVAATAEVAAQQKLAAALEKERQKTLKGQQAAYADREKRALEAIEKQRALELRAQLDAAARLEREQKKQADLQRNYDAKNLASRIREVEEVQRLISAGYSREDISQKYGSAALHDINNLDQLKALKATEDLERRAETERFNRVAESRRRLLKLNLDYDGKELADRVRQLERVRRVLDAGNSLKDVARIYGMAPLRDLENLPALKGMLEQRERLSKATGRNTEVLKSHTTAMHDARGAVRGLSGSLGMLWMTYGSLAPLLAGAGLGALAKNTFTIGKDLEYRLKFIEALGNAPVTTADLMPAVHGSMKTPLEAAQGMMALAQAGLTSSESLKALNTVMQVSTLGELSMEEAAVALTAALAAFNLTATDSARVGDVFAKAAAISNTSVEKISESMKQASTSAAQYNISLEETSAALAVMAQRNITGSSAGTAFRNMTKELYTPIARGAKAMEQLGLSAYNAQGNMKPFQDVLFDLRESLFGLNQESRNAALEAIFGERGSRAIKPILEDLENYVEKVKEMESANGFLAIASTKLIDTVEGVSNRLQSTLQQSFSQAFDSEKTGITSLLREIDKLAGSDGFKKFVSDTTSAFVTLASMVIEIKGELALLLAVYAASKVSSMAFASGVAAIATARKAYTAVVNGETSALAANTAARSANATAGHAANALQSAIGPTAATRAAQALGGVVGILSRLNVVVGLGSLAYMGYSYAMESASRTAEALQTKQDENYNRIVLTIAELEKQLELQEKLNHERLRGGAEQAQVASMDSFKGDIQLEASAREQALAQQKQMLELKKAEHVSAVQLLEQLRNQALGHEETARQQGVVNRLTGELAGLQKAVTLGEEHLLKLKGDQVRLAEIQLGLEQSLAKARNISGMDTSLRNIERYVAQAKEAQHIIKNSTDPSRVKQAKAVQKALGSIGISEHTNTDAIRARVGDTPDALKEVEDYASAWAVKAQDVLAPLERAVSFAPPTREPRVHVDRNSAESLLDSANRSAGVMALKTEGELKKASLQVTREIEKAQRKINETYLPGDVIAGLRAREDAENSYNRVLDARLAKIEEIEEAMKGVSDPARLSTAKARIDDLRSSVKAIESERDKEGAKAQQIGEWQYRDDNTAMAGIDKLFAKYRDESTRTGDIVGNALSSSFDMASTALEEFATTGKLNFASLTADILSNLSKMAMQMASNQLFGMLTNLIGGAIGGWGAGGADSSGMTYTPATTYAVNAKGNAFSSSGTIERFAKGGAFTNQVTSGTNVAPMAMFGEAGPEAIMPLTRTSDGSLGVRAVPIGASGTAGSQQINVSTNIYIQSDGSAKEETKSDDGIVKKLGQELNSVILDVIRKETRQGGIIHQAQRAA